ncbi:UvrD-helicase domain-containing protein [Paenibacillus alginolyticus]|uniref:UvrD-helicase domain-containing protein n=1 Tax=Paenibacillus alginolyticus TaxID=59839 RepID=UPI000402E9BD|nr:UvrD-helicase domain-containing protein [Paenibacillus alginolyticus]MCY9666472.1 UvrD-helicase domain-containing protein [Paenibacillus alginolyticus]
MLKEQELHVDEASRERISADLDSTFLVEAGAGSGKTTSIVGRMIALVKTGKAQVRDIAAITFTNKAASELMGRFRIRLEQELRKATHGPEKDALAEAVRQVPESFIGTIHAFCGRLLRERPIEAKLDAAFQEMDEHEDQEFRDQCWDEYLEQLREGGEDSHVDELAALQVHVEDLRAVYNKVSKYEDVSIHTVQTGKPDFDIIRESLFPMIEEASRYIPTAQPEKDWDDLQKTIRTATRHLLSKDMTDDMNVLVLARLFDRTLNVTLKRWTDPKVAKRMKEQFLDWQTTTLWPFLQAWREFLHPKLIAFVLPAVQYCQSRRMEAGRLNFQDLLMKAAELLRTYPEVRSYFGRRYSRLFVDEFQDTDPIQAEMMMLLTGADPSESNWREQLPRPGSLFVVGDPKQSIYRFRRADISTYNFVKERIRQCGDVLQLTRNFRSVKVIGDFINYAFESKFTLPGQTSDFQAPYVQMITQQVNPSGKKSLHGVYTMTVPKQERDRQEDIAIYDAERTAQFVAWACDGNLLIQEGKDHEGKSITRPARPNDFMILLNYRKFISLYAELLEHYGIASDTSGSRAVFEELNTLYLLAQTLNDPTDRVPLLAVLRGILFGISDDALYHYRLAGGSISLYSSLDSSVLSEKNIKVNKALRKLRQYAEWVNELPALSAFTQMIQDIGIVPAAAVNESGAIRSGTLIKLIELLQGDSDAAMDWRALTERLRKLMNTERLESASLFAGRGEAVKIMNLHKAKGLEATIVIMACPCGYDDKGAKEHIDRLSEPPLGYFTISKPKDAFNSEIIAQPVNWAELAEKEREYMHAEKDRLLYVAATRAKQLLVVSQYPSRPAIDPWSLLAVSLQRQVELDLDLTPISPVRAEKLKAFPNVEASLATWNSRLECVSKPTYQVASVTKLAKSSSEIVLVRSAEGKGMAYGNLVHRCLQALGEGMDVQDLGDFCRMAAEEESVDERWLEQAEATVLQVTESDMWRRCMNARWRSHEFSFITARQMDEGEKMTMLLRGVIDLVFEEEDGYVIVDFKTDRYESQQEQQFVDFYRPQVMAYVEEWERMLGGKVKEAGLYFIDKQRYVSI